jgi:hypothetical protein
LVKAKRLAFDLHPSESMKNFVLGRLFELIAIALPVNYVASVMRSM